MYNPDLTIFFKSKRIEYVTTLPRFSLPEEMVDRMSVAEKAENTLVNEMKLWGHKYAIMTFILSLNFTALLYASAFRYHSRTIRLIFSMT